MRAAGSALAAAQRAACAGALWVMMAVSSSPALVCDSRRRAAAMASLSLLP